MKEAGVLAGCIILVLIAFVGDFSLILIIQAGEISEKTTYQVFHIHIRIQSMIKLLNFLLGCHASCLWKSWLHPPFSNSVCISIHW